MRNRGPFRRNADFAAGVPAEHRAVVYERDLGAMPRGGYRGAERLVYSDNGMIFYTPDHYRTFEQLY